VLLLERVTTAPPDGAGALSVTVPVAEVGPVTAAGLTLTELTTVAAAAVKFTFMTWAPLIAIDWLAGVKARPLLLGVTT
jgi:hypothetical protein